MTGGRDVLLMKMLRSQLEGWLPVIARAAGAQKAELEVLEGGKEFAVVVTWKHPDRDAVKCTAYFSQLRVFGESMKGPHLTWRAQKRACDFARDIMREVLQQRGVLK